MEVIKISRSLKITTVKEAQMLNPVIKLTAFLIKMKYDLI